MNQKIITLLLFSFAVFLLFVVKGFPQKTTVYISAGGSDANPGSENAPVKSFEKIKELIREARQNQKDAEITVIVADGVYPLEQPLVFTSEESGTEKAPLIVKAGDGANPVFTGSRGLKKWKLLKEPSKLKMLPQEARNNVYVADLKNAGIRDLGDPIKPGSRPELFCNGQLQTPARWPNTGFTQAGLVKGDTELPVTFRGKKGTKEGIFQYTGQRQDRWAYESEVCLGGYWFWDWADEYQKVKHVDPRSKTLHLAEPYHRYGYRDSLRYFGVNLFCEIDQPGEWYLNREEAKLFWYPPLGVNPDDARVTLSLFSAPFMVELKDCSYVTLQGLAFEQGRGSAVLISGGKNCLIKNCRVEGFGQDGIHVDGGTGHGISGCLIRTLGFRGINMKGGDRKNLQPANHFIDHTIVEHFSLFKRTYEPAVYLEGCGMRVFNNRFTHSSSSAMRLEGNDFIIEYNEISKVVDESDDQGALDMWYNPSYRGIVVRYNRFSDITGGTHSGAAGVRLDDMISGVLIFGNIFERCGSRMFGGVQIHGGKDNIVENNLFYDCHAAVTFHSWGPERWLKELDTLAVQKKIFEEVDIRSSLYLNKYPELKSIRENADVNTIKDNLIIGCKNQFLRNKTGVQRLTNNAVQESEGKTAEECCSPEFLNQFQMQPIPWQQIGPGDNKWTNQ